MQVNPDANGADHDSDSLKYMIDTFTSHVIPANLVRLRRSDGTDEGVAAEVKSSKRKIRSIIITVSKQSLLCVSDSLKQLIDLCDNGLPRRLVRWPRSRGT